MVVDVGVVVVAAVVGDCGDDDAHYADDNVRDVRAKSADVDMYELSLPGRLIGKSQTTNWTHYLEPSPIIGESHD